VLQMLNVLPDACAFAKLSINVSNRDNERGSIEPYTHWL
jgi:hypothetical protein